MKNAPRQYRNQRLGKAKAGHQQVLEVSIRREKEQVRRVRTVLGLCGWLIFFAGLGLAAWVGTREGMRRWVWENPAFFLTDVRVKTDGTLTREQIIQYGDVVEGSNTFHLNEDTVRHKLLALPQVERVDVQRSLPHRVDIEVQERQPIAWLTEKNGIDPTATDRSFLIDRRGFIMKPRKSQQESVALPIISGVEVGNLELGKQTNILQVNSALELLRLNAGNQQWQIKNIDVQKKYCLLVTGRDHAEITFGLDEIDKQLSKLTRLLEYLEPQHRDIQTVNLLVKHNTPVTFFDEPEEVTAVVKPEGKDKPKADPRSKKATPEPAKPEARRTAPASNSPIRKPFRLHE